MRKYCLVALIALNAQFLIANETCIYILKERNTISGRALVAGYSCSSDSATIDLPFEAANDALLSKAKHIAKIQKERGVKLVNCSATVGMISGTTDLVNECLFVKETNLH